MNYYFQLFCLLLFLSIYACAPSNQKEEATTENTTTKYETAGSIETASVEFDGIIDQDAPIEIIAEGFEWAEGPVWVSELNGLLFSDIPPNEVNFWSEETGDSLYLQPAGYTGDDPRLGEKGSNGLVISPAGRLVLCQHGDRRIAAMTAPLTDPAPEFETIVAEYEGKKLNSPNDAIFDSQGNLYFTDPIYGLVKENGEFVNKEIDFQGVYLYRNSGELVLLTDTLTRPNGIALFPDEKKLLVANSDPEKCYWTLYDVNEDKTLSNGELFYDATDQQEGKKGLPDGLKIRDDGIIFATGPGGVWVFAPDRKHLGTIHTGQATSNCAFGPDKKTLFMTADMYLMRVSLQ